MRRPWLWIVIVVVLISAFLMWRASRPAATVEVIQAKTQDIRAYVEERAVTELPHDHLISMPISGWLQRIDLREGDAVNASQVVAKLETDDLEDRVNQARQRIAVLDTDIKDTLDHRLG